MPLRRSRQIAQSIESARLVPADPLVAGDARHSIKPAQLGHRPVLAPPVLYESKSLFHHTVFLPGHYCKHTAPSLLTMSPASSVEDLPGMQRRNGTHECVPKMVALRKWEVVFAQFLRRVSAGSV